MKALILITVVCLAILVLALKSEWAWRRDKRRYRRMQASRISLADTDFCQRAGLNPSAVNIVSRVRSELASLGGFEPLKIYPEDAFYTHFGLRYDDEVAGFVQGLKIIEGCADCSFPVEEVVTVADFMRVVLRSAMKPEIHD
jgi:hypothetical protein